MSGKVWVIYKYTGPYGRSYIGQTSNAERRYIQHKRIGSSKERVSLSWALLEAYSYPFNFYEALCLYGFNSFKYEVLKEVKSLKEALYWEMKLITEHDTLFVEIYSSNPERIRGYNVEYNRDYERYLNI